MIICTTLALGVHLASYHASPLPYQNNINPGVYVECDGWTTGVYRNTLRRTSVYAGYALRSGPFGLTLGAVSGYQKKPIPGPCRPGYYDLPDNPCRVMYGISDRALAPMIAPSAQYGGARIVYIPKLGGSTSAVFHLAYEWRMR